MDSSSIGFGAINAQANIQQARETRMLQQVQSGRTPTQDDKIAKGAKEFEAMLLGSWLQKAEQSFGTVPGADDDDEAAGRDQMMSLGVQSLSQSLAASGGIGIGAMVAKAMHRAAETQQPAEEPQKSGKF